MKRTLEILFGSVAFWIIITSLFVTVIGAAMLPNLIARIKNDTQTENKTEVEVENGEEWDGSFPLNGEKVDSLNDGYQQGIEIPGYSQVYGPEIQLINPKSNDVYFVYKIYRQGELIHETKMISPNQVVVFNSLEILGVGTHQVELEINTYDMETNDKQNGAVLNVEIINE